MFRVIIDGKEIGKFERISYAKKQADLDLELGGFFCEIYRGKSITVAKDGMEIGAKAMLKILKKALKSRQKKEKKFNKNYNNLQDITNKYLAVIQK